MPFFSIVIPTYNRANLISKTLESILSQTFQDFEVIIVDDGSTDNTEEIIQPFVSEKVHYFKKKNEERAVARNFGTQKATGEYICWFDSDDIMASNHLAHAKELISQNMHAEIVVLSHYISNTSLEIKHKIIIPFNPNNILYKGNIFSCNAVFVRKDIALSNPFNENRDLSVSEDYELWLRLAAQYQILSSPVPTSYIVQHNERSVNTMKDNSRLINRFTTFLNAIDNNSNTVSFLGKNYAYFKMKNYLILSADLAYFGFKKDAIYFLKKAFRESPLAISNKSFWATLKHILL